MAAGVILRRDLLLGAGCAAAAITGNTLKPHRRVSLFPHGSLAQVVPASFLDWRSQDMGDPLAINGPGTLSAKIYNQLVTRVYVAEERGFQVIMLLAYGGEQTDDLQLHRPEVCYPAFGYALTRNEPIQLPVAAGVQVPARRLIAQAEDHTEGVIYWSRIGEFLPTSGPEQRSARFQISLRGVIPDGLLSRFSVISQSPQEAWRVLGVFIPELLAAIQAPYRKVLIGTDRATRMAAALPRA